MTQPNRRGLTLMEVRGVQISIDVSWLVIFFLVLWSLAMGYFPLQHPDQPTAYYWVVAAVATTLFFTSVLTHELSHAFMANRLGHEVKRVTLFIFGGMAHLSGEAKRPADEFKIAAVGPLTSLALGGVFWIIRSGLVAWQADPLWTAMFSYLAFINVALAVFNLLPGYPLDGGRLLRAALWHRSGNLQAATARAADWGSGIAFGIMVLGGLQIFSGALIGGLWLIFIGMFLRGAARAGYYGLVLDHALAKTLVRDVMVNEPVTVPPGTSVADAVDEYFLRFGHTSYPVATNGTAEGLLTLDMVRSCPAPERPSRTVRDIMRPLDRAPGITIAPEAKAADALRQMDTPEVGRLLVVEHGRLVGMVTRADIVRRAQLRATFKEDVAELSPAQLDAAA